MDGIPVRIMLGSDHRGCKLFNFVVQLLQNDSRYEIVLIENCGAEQADYLFIAATISEAVCTGKVRFGIMVGATGIGMCIVSNKFPGVRAAICHNEFDTELSRKHNDANVLCLAGDMLGESTCAAILDKWFSTEFSGGRHQARLDKIDEIERDNVKKSAGIAETVCQRRQLDPCG
ncbi:MAG: ribose 5-phosphate isomerase B [Planctomycetaceae bacterium]|nr:ribose 5-phosphate isomerase B [Planctomycetaceae bacterium]